MRVRFIVGSFATHVAALAALASVRGGTRPPERALVVVELAPAPSPPPPLIVPAAPPEAAPAPLPPPPRRRIPAVPASASAEPPQPAPTPEPPVLEPAIATPVAAPPDPHPSLVTVPVGVSAGLLQGGILGETRPLAASYGYGRRARLAAVLQRVDDDVNRMRGSNERLSYFVRTWQHNDYVATCLRAKLARATGVVAASSAARDRLYLALAREDRRAVDAELVRLRRTRVDFQALYQASRTCIDRAAE